MAPIKGSITALFGSSQIRKIIEQKAKEYDEKAIKTLQYLGEQFVNRARLMKYYTDRTGNLRSSIGYIILHDGRIVERNFALSDKGSEKKPGLRRAKEYAAELAAQYPRGYVLIGVAGMEYAFYVEKGGRPVITGAEPTESEFKSIFDAIVF